MSLRIAAWLPLGLLLIVASLGSPAFGQIYYPGEQWRTATPESQGLDSQALAAAIDEIHQKQWGVHSLLVIRHGYVVADADFYPYNSSTPHDLASVTKTITSTLTGVAVANGLLKLDQPVISFFPQETPTNPDERKQAITVGNLLHMESGLDCGILPGEQELEAMKRSPNWVQFALSLPMKYDPGTHSAYCSPGYHLLGSAIGAASHMTEAEFAGKYLFGPLAIHGVKWSVDPQGRNHGWGDSHLYPRDVAKLGYLYLHGGEWNGQQILPRDWVAMSTAPAGLGIEWNATIGPNGLQYGGNGRGGQILMVWPDLDMIVVSTAGGNAGQLAPLIRAAVKANQPLAVNPEGDAQLKAKSEEASKAPAPLQPVKPAGQPGMTYEFPVNPSRIDSLKIANQGSDWWVEMRYYGELLHIPLSLDGVYRPTPSGPLGLPVAAAMIGPVLDVNFIGNINHYTIAFHGSSDHSVDVTVDEASGLMRNGHLTGVTNTH